MSDKKRPYFITAERVVALFDANPHFSSKQIGKRLNLHPAYVRKALRRNGRHTTCKAWDVIKGKNRRQPSPAVLPQGGKS